MQMSQRCAEVAPGIRPSVEGDDGADWCVVDAGTLLHVVICKMPYMVQLQPQHHEQVAEHVSVKQGTCLFVTYACCCAAK